MDVHDFSFQDELTPFDDNSLHEQLENTIHAAMLRQKLSSSMEKHFESNNPPLSTSSLHAEMCHITSLADEITIQKSLCNNASSAGWSD